MSEVYSVEWPVGLCGCGSKLTATAKRLISSRKSMVSAVSRAYKAPNVEIPVASPVEPTLPKIELEFLRVVREELNTLDGSERVALRASYVDQINEAQQHLQSLMRVLTMIEAFNESSGPRG